jgi:antitoxin (DNA-binding transcriptional repressor) of toxin-antitoxin stability system
MTSLQKKEKKEKYKEAIDGWFQYIGQRYDKSLPMTYIFEDETKYVEPLYTFTSLNFVIKILEKIPEKYYIKLLSKDKRKAIVFIRVVEQYLTRTRNVNIEFVDPPNIPLKYSQSEEGMWGNHSITLIQNVKQIVDNLNLTEEDIQANEGYFNTNSPQYEANYESKNSYDNYVENENGLTKERRDELVDFIDGLKRGMKELDDEDRLRMEDMLKTVKILNKPEKDAEARAKVKELMDRTLDGAIYDYKAFYKRGPLGKYPDYTKQILEGFMYKLLNIRGPIYINNTQQPAKLTIQNMLAYRLRHADNEQDRLTDLHIKKFPPKQRILVRKYIAQQLRNKRPIQNILKNNYTRFLVKQSNVKQSNNTRGKPVAKVIPIPRGKPVPKRTTKNIEEQRRRNQQEIQMKQAQMKDAQMKQKQAKNTKKNPVPRARKTIPKITAKNI